MKRKLILSGLIVAVVSVFVGGRVWADTKEVGRYLDSKQFVWVGTFGVESNLRPVSLTERATQVLTQQEFALSTAITETVNTLVQTKRASTTQAKQFFSEALNLLPESQVLDASRILARTGGSGVVEFDAEKGRYALQIVPIAGVKINVPSSVNVNLDEYIVPIGVNGNGGGIIRRLASSGIVKEVSAQEGGNSRVKVAVYFDRNDNGKWDDDEDVAPWAGVRVDLVNLEKQSGIELSDQWKDVYLDGAKNGMKASDLVNDLGENCPTAGVSAVDGDTRKTFLKREGEVFGSADDFEITGGKVYSIKGCEIPFYIIGYDLKKQFEENN